MFILTTIRKADRKSYKSKRRQDSSCRRLVYPLIASDTPSTRIAYTDNVMFILRNNLIPFKGFTAINLFGVLVCRRRTRITERTVRHERIHTAQMRETAFVFFYVWYLIEWLIRLCFKGNAYRKIAFEREAYAHDDEPDYLDHRPHYAWAAYLRQRKSRKKSARQVPIHSREAVKNPSRQR